MSEAGYDGHVGLVGIGRMGSAIGHRLLDLGERLVVWNRTPSAAAPLVERGAALAASPADVAAAAASAGEAVAAGWGGRDLAQLVRFVADAPAATAALERPAAERPAPSLQLSHGAAP